MRCSPVTDDIASAARHSDTPRSEAPGDTREPITDASAIAKGDQDLVGRWVDLENVKPSRVAATSGFWIDAGGPSIFVLPARHTEGRATEAKPGQTISVEGVVLQMPRSMREQAAREDRGNDEIYVYATTMK